MTITMDYQEYKFQFLIGRLGTGTGGGIVVYRYPFQFLIGRLGTKMDLWTQEQMYLVSIPYR